MAKLDVIETKSYIQDLVIETTRRCNLQCAHCLRGCAENKNINIDYIDDLLNNVDSIGSITFSGGEPTLNIEVVKQTLEMVQEKQIPVQSIYIVTNATIYSPKLIEYMDEWFKYCYACYYGETTAFDYDKAISYIEESGFGLAISIDEFHDQADDWAKLQYMSKFYYSHSKETQFYDDYGRPHGIILEGNAADNFAIEKAFQVAPLSRYEYEWDKEDNNLSLCYLNVDGRIYPSCDLSYDTQDNIEGNNYISKRSLADIIADESINYMDFCYYNEEIV